MVEETKTIKQRQELTQNGTRGRMEEDEETIVILNSGEIKRVKCFA